jgi:signal peptidase II
MSKATVYVLAAFVFALDQVTKHWAVSHLALDTQSVPLIPRVLYFTRTSNTGSAFGLFPGSSQILALAALAAAIAISVYVARSRTLLPWMIGIALALPLGGALGNFLDRIRLSYVVDFIDLRIGTYQWPVFNVADSAICIGVALLAIVFVTHDRAKDNDSTAPQKSLVEPSPNTTK